MLEHPNTVWISHMTRLYRCAPEHVRSVSSREMSQGLESNEDLPDMTSGVVQFRNLHNQTSVPSRNMTTPRIDTVMTDDRNSHDHEPSSERARSSSGIQPDAEPETITSPAITVTLMNPISITLNIIILTPLPHLHSLKPSILQCQTMMKV